MDRVSCMECRQCNRKGKPSVSRLSKYCDEHYIHRIKTKKIGFFTSIKDRLFNKRYDENSKGEKLKTKGFRASFFWR